jgi:hypothetical protein
MTKVFGLAMGLCFVLGGCQGVGGATALAPAQIPDGWKKEVVPNTKMSLVLPPYLNENPLPKESAVAQLMSALARSDSLYRMYVGPDTRGKECMVSVMAFSYANNGTNPEGAANEYVDLMKMFSMGGEVNTTKRKVDLPIGPAWRAVVTMGTGTSATSSILYAGTAKGRYYQVMFTESGAGDVVLVPDEEIMDSLRFE